MTIYSDIKDLAVGLINDEDGTKTGDTLVFQALKAAYKAILPWCAKRAVETLTFDAEGTTVTLPTDIYDIDAVVNDDTGQLLAEIALTPGMYVGDNASGNNWMVYPTGTLRFSSDVELGDTYTVYYRTPWGIPDNEEDDDAVLEIPEYAVLAVVYYMAAYILNPTAAQITSLNPWKTKVDSGNPEHNPILDHIRFLLKMFHDEVNRFPSQLKGTR